MYTKHTLVLIYQAVCWFKFDPQIRKSRSKLLDFMPFNPVPKTTRKPTGLAWCFRLLKDLWISETKSNLYCFIALMKENKEARPVRLSITYIWVEFRSFSNFNPGI